jgi:hypothetical protein
VTKGHITQRDLSFFLVDFDELTYLLILYTFLPTLELNIYFDVYNSKLAFRLCSPNISSDYLPPLSVSNFVLTFVRCSYTRYTAAVFPAICLFSDLCKEQECK